ncbi:3-hydroxyacyl-[acyl-carrier-protein] dehydratase [Dokdonella fugitiva]|jgi:3-hydroxyacyl-[acyl-carrier-protein] dehydratase|uniref:3-hydroxyacyl-[acyl-carrier-protein] dehydratase FabZ n=2 Tax=Dokdonella fugitiva TaxID=328517 RepID=A0A4R2I3U1_9GAMM|nr:3-hydroxyacyl-[acyl-carrier-protein] dehydratase [Dokdonella fugitiva]TCO38764.1 3-hydroxyacyl-[acyl-carrier-protein] dehydratase [Dokdonella fugitiva]
MNMPPAPVTLPLGVEQIAAMLPHRYPFLLIDRVLAFEHGTRVTALKNVTFNEPFFQGHFPGHPVMPGVLIIEAMAQSAGMLVKLSAQHNADVPSIFYLVKVDKARFNRTVVPGDQLRLEVEHKRRMRNMSQFWGRALVDDVVVAEAEMLCAEVAAG